MKHLNLSRSPGFPRAGRAARRGGRGFTLLELLVVIAIIAILAALLLPALSKAKERAQRATDLSNSRQILMATHLYAGDSGDFLPRPGWSLPSACWAYGAPFPYALGQSAPTYAAFYPGQLAAVATGQLFPYLKAATLFMCPGDRPNARFYERGMYISSYVWNGAVTSYDRQSDRTHRVGEFRPTGILQWESDETFPATFNNCANYPYEGFTRRHGGRPTGDMSQSTSSKATVGTFDGGAKQMSAKDLYQMTGGQAAFPLGPPWPANLPNDLWCNPASRTGTPSGF